MSELQAAHRAGRVLAAAERYRRAWEANEPLEEARYAAACAHHGATGDEATYAVLRAAEDAADAAWVVREDAADALLAAARGDL